jgi:hypothetical protein
LPLGLRLFDHEMCLRAAARNDASSENLGDHASRIRGTIDPVIRQLVGRQTLGVECPKTRFVAEQGTSGHGHAPREQNFHGRIQPDHRHARGTEKFGCSGLRVSATAQREYDGFPVLENSAECESHLIGLNLAEFKFTVALKDLRDPQTGGRFDAVVKIDKTPGQLPGKQSANGGFAGAHKTGKAKHLHARALDSRNGRLHHSARAARAAGSGSFGIVRDTQERDVCPGAVVMAEEPD